MARVVLVTGVSRYLGGLLARRIATEPGVEHVVGVDVIPPPHDVGGVEFVRADIRNPMISRVIESAGVDTVVHMNVIATPTFVGGRTPQKEINVIGTMQLLAACQKSRTVQRLVVKSSAAVYGSTPRDPAMFTEDMGARRTPSGGFGKDSIEVEGYVRGFARRRPDTEILMLRLANVIGPRIRTSITDYFSMPVIPVPLGYDARMQFLHEDDAIDALVLGGTGSATGVVNVAGDGVVTVLQAASLVGRPVLPLPLGSAGFVGGMTRRLGLADFSPDQMGFLAFGRGLDTTRMRTVLGFEPRFTTREAFEAFAATVGAAVPGGGVVGDAVSGLAGSASQAVLRLLGAGSGR
ncbi:MAG: NAD-dependent epimerase/dehydratase family protein [Micrococcales bacterium]|uniref:NAD-dependent epimerase/dehydratase family protein n=1 Tax=Phycicoccus sp. TaxID=1902410 RepID=UPI0019BC87ED|nr:NAD-dependent epimerase/dehydratase family protein [Phycicoccus sp.]MBD3784938.1 NAD-dependent epimerase/dehydratase family protein [Micrococcales bacterium]HMM95563.1 NAD-dependent epimerase/dehydratase family protein [Phycicoccus sp.]